MATKLPLARDRLRSQAVHVHVSKHALEFSYFRRSDWAQPGVDAPSRYYLSAHTIYIYN
jgi:hypothetical protein